MATPLESREGTRMTKEATLAVQLFIRERRNKMKLSQEALAERAGVTTATISNLETGRNGFTDKTLAAVATALNCRPIDLLMPMGSDQLVSGEVGIKNLLRRIDGLPDEAVNHVWRLISGYIEDAE